MTQTSTFVQRAVTVFIILACLFLTVSCTLDQVYPKRRVGVPSGEPGPVPGVASEHEMLNRAEQAHLQGQYNDSLKLYEDFMATYPYSDRGDSALAAIGQLRERLELKSGAVSAYQELLQRFPNSTFAEEARRRLAALYLEAGLYDRAAAMVGELLGRTTDPNEQSRLRLLLGKTYLAQGNRSGALDLFRRVFQETSDRADKNEAVLGLKASVETMNPDELNQAQTLMGLDYPGSYIAYVLAYRLYEAGDTAEAKGQLVYYLKNFPDDELRADAETLMAAIDGQGQPPTLVTVKDFLPKPDPGFLEAGPESAQPIPERDYHSMDVACVLPLSEGPGASYGRQVLKGLELAFNTYQAQTPGFKARLIALDTKGNPAQAVQMVEQASAKSNILAVVGPLVSKCAYQGAKRAEELSLPMITITQAAGVPQTGPHIFRLYLTPREQARAVARYTVQILGLLRLAILYPEDSYGRAMKGFFEQDVRELGGEIVAMRSYDPKATDYSPAIQELAGVGKALRRVGAGRKVQVDFEAVFLPDGYRAVAMIAPQFAYHDITTIRLLGTSLWHNPQLLTSAARYVQRSVIPTAFFPNMEDPQCQEFVTLYQRSEGYTPTEPGPAAEGGAAEESEKRSRTAQGSGPIPNDFVAYGYDAGRLLLTLMDKQHVSTREEIVEALTNMSAFEGVTGRFTFSSDGEWVSEPVLITVEGEDFQLIQ